jgi:hypothetical protein
MLQYLVLRLIKGCWHAACRPVGAILVPLRGSLFKILHPNFREYLFHELGCISLRRDAPGFVVWHAWRR